MLPAAGFVAIFIEASYLTADWSNVGFNRRTCRIVLQHFAICITLGSTNFGACSLRFKKQNTPTKTMIYPTIFVMSLVVLLIFNPNAVVAQVHKCTDNGSIIYQNTPCAPTEPRKQPTVEQLNAERKKNLTEANDAATRSPAARPVPKISENLISSAARPDTLERDSIRRYQNKLNQASPNFSCDSRKYCSQMTSCAEAKYFLTSCPGVKMDGNADGIPCEQQWCK